MEGQFWYVYMLQSVEHPEHYYVGMTENLAERLKAHNARRVPHTSKFAPWRIETCRRRLLLPLPQSRTT